MLDEASRARAPPGSRNHALPAEGHAAEPLLLALQQTMHELEDGEDITAVGEDAELAVERRTARSGEIADPLLEGVRLRHGRHVGGGTEIEGHRGPRRRRPGLWRSPPRAADGLPR